MKKLFDLPDHARVWIYQSDQRISPSVEQQIIEETNVFLAEWTSHGNKMAAAFEVWNARFLVLGVDESSAGASGCGIDKSVRHFQELGQKTGFNFFIRTLVSYMEEEELKTTPLNQFWALRKAGVISGQTKVFDTTIKTIGELKASWLVPFEKSWHQEMWGR